MDLSPDHILPDDKTAGLLIGRAWLPGPTPGQVPGPSPVVLDGDQVRELTALAPTVSALLEIGDLAARLRGALAAGSLPAVGKVSEMLANSAWDKRRADIAHFLAPADLQSLRASGVTFVDSMLERVIEEQAKGDPQQADSLRASIAKEIGTELAALKPGSPEAAKLKASLIERGLWSQYLEVGIGPDAEIFTKSQPMSAVGSGAEVGILASSVWNNPEPEVAVVVNSRGEIAGATLGNDVNLRDVEGRSALLLGRAKDNNASCAIGPFIRLFDDHFTLDSVRQARVALRIEGADDGFVLEDASDMREISRDPLELVDQTIGAHHQYPDGLMLFLGTMFSPIEDRDGRGQGFTHHLNDRVTIATPSLGALVNVVDRSDRLPPWTFGLRALHAHLARRRQG